MLQHEIDHLDGVLILDRTEREQRKGAMRALREGTSFTPPDAEDDEPRTEPTSEPEHAPETRARQRVRLAYLGTSEFAATVPAPAGAEPVPARPRRDRRRIGRRRAAAGGIAPPPAAAAAAELGLEVHQTADVNEPESLAALERAGIDLGLVCAFGQLLRPPLLERFELLNVHPRCSRAGAARRRSSGRSWPATSGPAWRSSA